MSTPTEELTVDLDALDAKAAAAKNGQAKPDLTVEPPEEPPKKALTPEEGIDTLKKQLADAEAARDEERRGRVAAEARANEAAKGEVSAKIDVQKTQLEQIKGAIEQTTQQSTLLESQYEAALTNQDWKTAAQLQTKIAKTAARLEQLEAGKTRLESAPKPVVRVPDDPVEAFCAQLSPESARWVRSHPEYVTDQRQNRRMIRAHEDAIDAGCKADSPEYFGYVEKRLGMEGKPVARPEPDDDDPTAAAAKPVERAAPPAAPVSRSNGKSNTVRLTRDQLEAAEASGLTPEDYARNVLALKKEGKLQ